MVARPHAPPAPSHIPSNLHFSGMELSIHSRKLIPIQATVPRTTDSRPPLVDTTTTTNTTLLTPVVDGRQ
ncbi:hypothetical protein E2C01_102860 [Portunus trituberculatus]|uniref:Uncharacterized protein n=1 Tax=Portunus trituberculatus TaxID=210409 RepID=A0A5B7KNS0_PORTR|nr:hypothetical protein [Portunus trituberculatus]